MKQKKLAQLPTLEDRILEAEAFARSCPGETVIRFLGCDESIIRGENTRLTGYLKSAKKSYRYFKIISVKDFKCEKVVILDTVLSDSTHEVDL